MSAAYGTEWLKRADRPLSRAGCRAGRMVSRTAARRAADPRPLVVRPGGMGDLILAQVALEELGHDPAQALWLLERRSAPWARHAGLPFVAYDDGFARTVASLAGRHRVVVNTEQRFGLSQAMALAALRRDGTLTAFATNRAARDAHAAVPYDPYDEHESVAFRRLLGRALGDGGDGPAGPRPRGRRRPATAPPLVAISGRRSATRALDLATWTRLVSRWAGARPIAIAAAPEDRPFADALRARLPSATSFAGGFGVLCDRIAAAEELFTVDGGPVHIASYYGVPATAVFTSGRSAKWSPLAEGSRVVVRDDLPCQPCTLFGQTPPCPYALACHRLDLDAHGRPAPAVAGLQPAAS